MSYIMMALGLLIALVMTYTLLMQDPDAKFRRMDAQSKELASQAYLVKRLVLDCALLHPNGDNGTFINPPYPAGDTPVAITSLTCPGAPYTDKSLWRGEAGTFVPKTLPGWSVWQYTNDATNIRIAITGDVGNADAINILNRMSKEFSPGETSIDNATKTLTVYIKK